MSDDGFKELYQKAAAWIDGYGQALSSMGDKDTAEKVGMDLSGFALMMYKELGEPEKNAKRVLLAQPVTSLDLSIRAEFALEARNIKTIGQLAEMSEKDLLRVKNFGRKSLRGVKFELSKVGLTLNGMHAND